MKHLVSSDGQDIHPDVVSQVTFVKREFAVLFVLVYTAPSLPLPDPSNGGSPDDKWQSVCGTFVVWTSDTVHERLSDRHGLRLKM